MATEVERRWVVHPAPDTDAPLLARAPSVELEQVYLRAAAAGPEGGSARVRSARAVDGTTRCTLTVKRGSGAVREELEEIISTERYERLRETEADPDRRPVRKTRHRVRWQGRLWELDELREPVAVWLLECELPDEAALRTRLTLPPPCRHAVEVTEDDAWTNGSLARGVLPALPRLTCLSAPRHGSRTAGA